MDSQAPSGSRKASVTEVSNVAVSKTVKVAEDKE